MKSSGFLGGQKKVHEDVNGSEYFYDERAFHVAFTTGSVPQVRLIAVWDSRFVLENWKGHVGRFTSFDVARWYSVDLEAINVRTFPSELVVDFPSITLTFHLRAEGDYVISHVEMLANSQ